MKIIDVKPFLMSDDAGGHRFCLLLSPAREKPHTLVLHAQAMGLELNLSRRQVYLTSRALAMAGAAVLIVDLEGCGDSTGDTLEDPWGAWDVDLQRAASWLRSQWPGCPLWGWGFRGGALALAQAWPAGDGPEHWLFWQPILDGAELHRHWQRQALATALAEQRDGRTEANALQQAWQAGRAAVVAGAVISASLAHGANARTLSRVPPRRSNIDGRLVWIDVSAPVRAAPVPRTTACLGAWEQAGWQLDWRGVEGPPFWLGPEIGVVPALTEATARAVHGARFGVDPR